MVIPYLPGDIWTHILRLRFFVMQHDLVTRAPTLDFRDPAQVCKVQTTFRELGYPIMYADTVADMRERHTAWHMYYA